MGPPNHNLLGGAKAYRGHDGTRQAWSNPFRECIHDFEATWSQDDGEGDPKSTEGAESGGGKYHQLP